MYLGCEALCSQEALSRCIHLLHLDLAFVEHFKKTAERTPPSEEGNRCKHFGWL